MLRRRARQLDRLDDDPARAELHRLGKAQASQGRGEGACPAEHHELPSVGRRGGKRQPPRLDAGCRADGGVPGKSKTGPRKIGRPVSLSHPCGMTVNRQFSVSDSR